MAEERISYETGHRDYMVNVFGVDKVFKYPISLNHLALMEYSPDWSIEKIVVFEKFVVFFHIRNCHQFEYQQTRLYPELHIKRYKLEKLRLEFNQMGILKEYNPGKGKKLRYIIDRDRLIELLPQIYKMPKDKAKMRAYLRELKEFFLFYLTPKYEYAKMKGIEVRRASITGKRSGNVDQSDTENTE